MLPDPSSYSYLAWGSFWSLYFSDVNRSRERRLLRSSDCKPSMRWNSASAFGLISFGTGGQDFLYKKRAINETQQKIVTKFKLPVRRGIEGLENALVAPCNIERKDGKQARIPCFAGSSETCPASCPSKPFGILVGRLAAIFLFLFWHTDRIPLLPRPHLISNRT